MKRTELTLAHMVKMTSRPMMLSTRQPVRGDVVFLRDGASFTYVARLLRADMTDAGPVFEVMDNHGEDFSILRATERDDELRMAVHDDGRRVAWRLTD